MIAKRNERLFAVYNFLNSCDLVGGRASECSIRRVPRSHASHSQNLSRCYEIVVAFHKMLLFHYELTALKLHALAFTGKRVIRITKGIKIGNFVSKSGLVALAMLS